MTTAAQKLAEFGYTMQQGHDWLFANLGNPQVILDVCAGAHITNEMLGEIAAFPGTPYSAAMVKGFFQANGLDSSGLDATGSATVTAVNDAGADEGQGIYLTVELAHATTEPTLIPVSANFQTASLADLAGYTLNMGVTFDGGNLHVPAGVDEFLWIISAADDSADEPAEETFTITIGGVTANAFIQDNDDAPPPPEGSVLLPSYLEGFSQILDFNDHTGVLATASMRTEILKYVSADKYWALFDPARFEGSADGKFSVEELGTARLGEIDATKENIESIFYGTFFDVTSNTDFQEAGVIGNFFVTNLAAIFAHDPVITAAYVDLQVDASLDAAAVQAKPDAGVASTMIVGIAGLAGAMSQANIFEYLIQV